jgi:hypothetical protein
MATTTNYSWETPDDTDLVKDGAAAIRTLGSSIDTTTKALNPSTTLGDIEYRSSTANTNTRLGIGSSGQVLTVVGGVPAWGVAASGMTYVGGATFTAASSQSLNNVFTSTYENYVIVLNVTAKSAATAVEMRMRASGTDNTTSNYHSAADYFQINGAGAGTSKYSGYAYFSFNNVSTMQTVLHINNPQATQNTIYGSMQSAFTYSTDFYTGNNSGVFNATTSFDGFTIYPTSGTFTGTVRVYGIANS